MTYVNDLRRQTGKASTEAVEFRDGMLVTAEDLKAAMRYPLSVGQVLFRGFFGCGVVCGLELKHRRRGQGQPAPVPDCPVDPKWFELRVERGVALDCAGYPIELCQPVTLKLMPDPCLLDAEWEMYIAIKRFAGDEPARSGGCGQCGCSSCGCDAGGAEPAQQCNRTRDHALIQAFDEPPPGMCKREERPDGAVAGAAPAVGDWIGVEVQETPLCACLKRCTCCDCHGEGWVLLGTARVSRQLGIVSIERGDRRDVQPIACACDHVDAD